LSAFPRRFPDLDVQDQAAEVDNALKLAEDAPRDR